MSDAVLLEAWAMGERGTARHTLVACLGLGAVVAPGAAARSSSLVDGIPAPVINDRGVVGSFAAGARTHGFVVDAGRWRVLGRGDRTATRPSGGPVRPVDVPGATSTAVTGIGADRPVGHFTTADGRTAGFVAR